MGCSAIDGVAFTRLIYKSLVTLKKKVDVKYLDGEVVFYNNINKIFIDSGRGDGGGGRTLQSMAVFMMFSGREKEA